MKKKIMLVYIIDLFLFLIFFVIYIHTLPSLKSEVNFEIYTTDLKKSDLFDNFLYKISKIDIDFNSVDFDKIGTYLVNVSSKLFVRTIKINIVDTTKPEVITKNATISIGEKVNNIEKQFIESIKDASDIKFIMLDNSIDYSKTTQKVAIRVVDMYDNSSVAITNLNIVPDAIAPVINGLNDIEIAKKGKIDYRKGVTARDNIDGKIDFEVDYSSVNANKVGTYYAVYTASDSSNNVTTMKRKIVVKNDKNDLNSLIAMHAQKSGSDYESIRKYVSNLIKYSFDWGGDNPTYYGLTQLRGNCYVHAYVYKALLEYYGYEVKIIWTTEKTHYWNLVKIDGVWRHSDSTPVAKHMMISASTDSERLEHLQGRDWDHSLWPEAK